MWLKWKSSFVLATKEGVEGDQLHSDLQLSRDGTEVVQSAQSHLKQLSTLLTEFRGTVRNAMKTNEWGRYHGAPDEMVLVAFRRGLSECLREIEGLQKYKFGPENQRIFNIPYYLAGPASYINQAALCFPNVQTFI